MSRTRAFIALAACLAVVPPAAAQHDMHRQHMQAPQAATELPRRDDDARELVRLPDRMQEHMLANMRDHLVTLSEIIGHLADGRFDAAATLSEQRLGMSSLSLHDAAHLAPFMPQPMQDAGTSMHRAASRLAITLQNAAVSPSLDAVAAVNRDLHAVTGACTACHASYRIR